MEFIFVAATKSHNTNDCDAETRTVKSVTGILDGLYEKSNAEIGEYTAIDP